MAKSITSFLKPSLNWLLAFIPITLFMEHAMPDKPVFIFLCAAFAIIPIASLIVQSTE
jgi:Ca2+:H+ antiporter